MHETLTKDRLKDIATLPTIPAVLSKLIKTLQNERSSIFEISEILRHDQSISSRVVAVANSPFFGCPGKINSIEQAVLMLGFDMVKSISLGVSVFGLLPMQYSAVKKMWAHSYGVAVLAGHMCSRIPVADKGICFLGGLLHDIGRIVFLKLYRDEYLALFGSDDIISNEVKRFNCSHAAAGGWFLENLCFPGEIVLSVRNHHSLAADTEHKGIATSVYLAEGLISIFEPGLSCDGEWSEEHRAVFEENGLGDGDMKEMAGFLKSEEEVMRSFFDY